MVDAKKFVKTWQKSESVSEVAAKFKTSKEEMQQQAYVFRKNGVPLKKMVRRISLNWDKLAVLAKQYN